jgi:long-chain fatty acid transport protein
MKRVLTCAGGLLLSCVFVSNVYAGAAVNKTNWSAEYIRTLNRNAATDYADIAAFNPAGTVKLQEGFTANISGQYLAKDYTNKVDGKNLESDKSSAFPGAFVVFRKDKWALFGSFTFVGGGGEVDFEDGNATTVKLGTAMNLGADRALDGALQQLPEPPNGPGPQPPAFPFTYYGTIKDQHIKGESYDLGYAIGAAYAVNDVFSVSAAIRYVDGTYEGKGSVTTIPTDEGSFWLDQLQLGDGTLTSDVDFEQDADGWGAIFGINIAPNEKLNIGARFETATELEFDTDVNKDTNGILPLLGVEDGEKYNKDLAPSLGLGISYWLTEQLRMETNLTLYFNDQADWEGAEKNVDTGFDAGLALEYHFTDSLLFSIGYMYTKLGFDPEDMLPENPELDANTVGGGIAYAFNEKFHINFGLGHSWYEDDDFKDKWFKEYGDDDNFEIEYEKDITFVALGMEYRF